MTECLLEHKMLLEHEFVNIFFINLSWNFAMNIVYLDYILIDFHLYYVKIIIVILV